MTVICDETTHSTSQWLVHSYGWSSNPEELLGHMSDITSSPHDSRNMVIVLSTPEAWIIAPYDEKVVSAQGCTVHVQSCLLHQDASSCTISPELHCPLTTAEEFRMQFHRLAAQFITSSTVLAEVENGMGQDCSNLSGAITTEQANAGIDVEVVFGLKCRLTARVMAGVLLDQNLDAAFLSVETDFWNVDQHTITHDKLDEAVLDKLSSILGDRVKKSKHQITVIPGVRLGLQEIHGGKYKESVDLLSGLIAAGLQASELRIWKEADGIFTADPTKVSTAQVLPVISPEELAELVGDNADSFCPLAMRQALRHEVPIRIKNIHNPAGTGTLIHPDPEASLRAGSAFPVFHTSLGPGLGGRTKLPTAVTVKEHIIVIDISSTFKMGPDNFICAVFRTLDHYRVAVNLMSTSEAHVSVAIRAMPGTTDLQHLIEALEKCGTVFVQHEMAILTLVGRQMTNMIGIAGHMFTTLAKRNVNIEMMSQSASEISISCVIHGKDAIKALNLVHHSCLNKMIAI